MYESLNIAPTNHFYAGLCRTILPRSPGVREVDTRDPAPHASAKIPALAGGENRATPLMKSQPSRTAQPAARPRITPELTRPEKQVRLE